MPSWRCCTAIAACAQSYPSRVIKLVVPFTPGSPNDVMARLLTQHLAPRLGQPIVIDNKPGGGTSIGTKVAAAAEPDGYTLLFISSAIVIDPAMKQVAYDPLKDFAPVATVNTTAWLIAVSPSLPVEDDGGVRRLHQGASRHGQFRRDPGHRRDPGRASASSSSAAPTCSSFPTRAAPPPCPISSAAASRC